MIKKYTVYELLLFYTSYRGPDNLSRKNILIMREVDPPVNDKEIVGRTRVMMRIEIWN